MSAFRYMLERGGSKNVCPACKQRRFVRYIDTETGEQLADEVGRCDREESCGYHLTPREYFLMTGKNPFSSARRKREPIKKPEPVYIPPETMQASFAAFERNNFAAWLCGVFGEEKAFELANRYNLGSSKHWYGACVFWQVDEAGWIHAGKVMLYDADTGRRVKQPGVMVRGVHWLLGMADRKPEACLFGLHLLSEDTLRPIAVVESEKSALIGAGFVPEFTWMATGGSGNLNPEVLKPLRGRDVVLMPDLGPAFGKWKEVGRQAGVRVSNVLEDRATEQDRTAGLDIADFLLREHFTGRRQRYENDCSAARG